MSVGGAGVAGSGGPHLGFWSRPGRGPGPQWPAPHLSGEAQPSLKQGQVPGQAVREVWSCSQQCAEGSVLPKEAQLSPASTY